MAIEDNIKQTKPFRNEWERMVVNLMHTGAWINAQAQERFAEFDLTPQQYNVLRILRGSSPTALSTSDIRDRMLDRASDTSRIVERLVAKDYVAKKVCAEDKRRVDVVITKKGLKLLEAIDANESSSYSYARTLTKAEAQQLTALLDKLKGA